MSRPIHAILKWNPTAVFNPLAPDGIKLWTEVFEKFPVESSESYSWWGKLSMGKYVGMQPPEQWAIKFNRQIQEQTSRNRGEETHLYMYCSDSDEKRVPSLHVGKVLEVVCHQNSVGLDDSHVPSAFYTSKRDENEKNRKKYGEGKLIPYWFKLADIRQIPVEDRHNLLVCDLDGNPDYPFDPTMNEPYPCAVVEEQSRTFFDPEGLERKDRRAWWEESRDIILVSVLQPGGEPSRLRGEWVPNRPKEMAICVAPLLRHSNEILFVDPHFDPYAPRFVNTLRAFLEHAVRDRHRQLKKLEYHLLYQPDPKKVPLSKEAFATGCHENLAEIIPVGFNLTLKRWSCVPDGEDFHDRFIITDLGGVQFGKGLDAGKPKHRNTVFITLLDSDNAWVLQNRFHPETNDYLFVDEVRVEGNLKGRSCSRG